jgi:starch synthase
VGATLHTIHNMAYQGVFWHWDMLLTGIDWRYFNWQQME